MKNLDPIPYAVISFVICLALLFAIDFVFQVIIEHGAFQPKVFLNIVLALAGGIGGFFQRNSKKN